MRRSSGWLHVVGACSGALLLALAGVASAQTTEPDKALKSEGAPAPSTPAPTPPPAPPPSEHAPAAEHAPPEHADEHALEHGERLPAKEHGTAWEHMGRLVHSLHPEVSAVVDFSAGWYSQENVIRAGDDPGHTGFNAQQIELALQAAVDRYFRADIFLVIPNLKGLAVDEAFLTTTRLPCVNLQLKAGIFRAGFGRDNVEHLHQLEFTRRPTSGTVFLGVDGLRAPGMELNWLVPKLPFSLLFAFSVFSPKTPDPDVVLQSFGGGKPWDFAYVASARATFPPRRATAMSAGLSYAHGKTAQSSTTSCLVAGAPCVTAYDNFYDHLFGADFYLRWRPEGDRFRVIWQTEFFLRAIPGLRIVGVPHSQTEGGLYTQVVAQVARRWSVGLRGEILGLPRGDNVRSEAVVSSSVTFEVSELSRIRAYGELRAPFGPDNPNAMYVSGAPPTNTNGALFTQFEVALGSHGASF